jgi:hypothetical protein
MEYFEVYVILRLIYKNHRILLDSFDQVQIDEIQHRTEKSVQSNIKTINNSTYFAFHFK